MSPRSRCAFVIKVISIITGQNVYNAMVPVKPVRIGKITANHVSLRSIPIGNLSPINVYA
jgi:hypothetical protein